jgi:hypothetical protein
MENQSGFTTAEIVSIATRTLLAAGYVVSGSHRQPDHIEFKCERVSRLGAVIRFLIAITDKRELSAEHAADIQHTAANQNRVPVLVASEGSTGQLSLKEFLDVLGGAVPSWRALTNDYNKHLELAAKNELPPGLTGEPWRIFEMLVADGLEFCLGRRVNQLGGQKRGKKVSDMIAPLPDFNVIVVDAKASANGFDATWPSLRPLIEYVNKQKERQQGGGEVIAALVSSSKFLQDDAGLTAVARDFLGETRTPLCFVDAATLSYLVNELRQRSDIRNSVRWNMLFSGGQIKIRDIDREIRATTEERCDPREF